MSSSNSDPTFALVLGFGAGLFFFFRGFRIYRKYRILADTPEMPIRSIPMGLVEVHGKAKGDQLVTSPVSKTPCFFYQVDIEKWVRDKNRGHWAHAKTDADGAKFYLDDGTGKVLVDAHSAEYDLIRSARRETGRGFGSSWGRTLWGKKDPTLTTGPRATDSELLAYAQSVLSSSRPSVSLDAGSILANLAGGSLSLGGSSSDRYRLTEYCILPDHWYDLTGTCVENPNPQDEHDRNLIVKGENEPTFLISWRSEKEIERTLHNRALFHIFGGAALSIVCLGILLWKFGWF